MGNCAVTGNGKIIRLGYYINGIEVILFKIFINRLNFISISMMRKNCFFNLDHLICNFTLI